MCSEHFELCGVGLGLGKGQRLLTEEPMMTYDPKRDPLTMHPLYSLMQGVLHVLNSTAYYDSGRWVMDRDEALTLVETAFKHKMEQLDKEVMDNIGYVGPGYRYSPDEFMWFISDSDLPEEGSIHDIGDDPEIGETWTDIGL